MYRNGERQAMQILPSSSAAQECRRQISSVLDNQDALLQIISAELGGQ